MAALQNGVKPRSFHIFHPAKEDYKHNQSEMRTEFITVTGRSEHRQTVCRTPAMKRISGRGL
jgi:hypothetical protein